MIAFVLNDRKVQTDLPPGTSLLDFIRYDQRLTGTKIGCREGDCGACTVLEGRLENDRLIYRSIVSCLTPIGNANRKHIVTIEGLNMERLSPVQQALVDHNGTQCGFCTPGFVLSLTCHAMKTGEGGSLDEDSEAAIASMDGNICRCTGYKSIERAAISLARLLQERDPADPMAWLVDNEFLPAYFLGVSESLKQLNATQAEEGYAPDHLIMGGGTDLMVQRPEEIAASRPRWVIDREEMKGIRQDKDRIVIGAAATAGDIMESVLMAGLFPDIRQYFKLISSVPIRNMGTLGGNLVNASPIGDLSIFFLVLDAELMIKNLDNGNTRTVPLRNFFLDYKKTDLQPGEAIITLSFPVPEAPFSFNFEKVSRRTHLDIASVNTAIFLNAPDGKIINCRLSCGGVAPVPMLLKQTGSLLSGKMITSASLAEAARVLQQEIAPIGDIRGSAGYKRLLARQLFFAHFIRLYPEVISLKELSLLFASL